MVWESLRGHHRQVEMFRRAIRRGRLAHAFLLVGPPGIGKRTFALRVTQCLFCTRHPPEDLQACGECPACKQVLAHSHPDLMLVNKPEGRAELPIDLLIGAPDRRGREGLCHDLALRPMSAMRRVAIIDDAETMNDAGANALLKTLEEPPSGSVMFLIVPETESILTTIRSRCHQVLFSPLPSNDLTDLILQEGIAPDRDAAQLLASLSDGSLATASQLQSGDWRSVRERVCRELAAKDLDSQATAALLLATMEELGGDPASQRRSALWLVRFMVDFYRQLLGVDTGGSTAETALITPVRQNAAGDLICDDRWGLMLERCLTAEMNLSASMPIPLCLEALCHDLGRIGRGALLTV